MNTHARTHATEAFSASFWENHGAEGAHANAHARLRPSSEPSARRGPRGDSSILPLIPPPPPTLLGKPRPEPLPGPSPRTDCFEPPATRSAKRAGPP